MARPKRGNYATGEAGLARYKEALRKYLAKTKKTIKPEVKKPEAKKPVAKKPVAKKPATKKTATNLKIKKAANTTRQALKKAAPKVKKAVKTVAKKAGEAKQAVGKKVASVKKTLNKKSPVKRPTTTGQKLASKTNKALQKAGKYAKGPLAKNVGSKLKAIGKGIAKDPRSVLKGVKGAGASILAEKLSTALVNRASKTVFGKDRLKAGKAKLADVRKNPDKYERTLTGYRLKGTGSKKESSTSKNIKKQKKANTAPSSGLKIKKTQYSSGAAKKKQNFGAATGTKKADKRFGTFREGSTENRKLQLERQKGNKETYSRKLSKKAEDTKTKSTKTSGKKMHAIEKRNRERFGDAHVDRLKRQHEAFKKRRKKK